MGARAHIRVPLDPIYVGTPLGGHGISGAQNEECLGTFLSGPTGGLSGKNLIPVRFSNCAWGSEPTLQVLCRLTLDR